MKGTDPYRHSSGSCCPRSLHAADRPGGRPGDGSSPFAPRPAGDSSCSRLRGRLCAIKVGCRLATPCNICCFAGLSNRGFRPRRRPTRHGAPGWRACTVSMHCCGKCRRMARSASTEAYWGPLAQERLDQARKGATLPLCWRSPDASPPPGDCGGAGGTGPVGRADGAGGASCWSWSVERMEPETGLAGGAAPAGCSAGGTERGDRKAAKPGFRGAGGGDPTAAWARFGPGAATGGA